MNILVNLFFISIICTIVVDMSDFPITVKKVLRLVFSRGTSVNTNYRLHLVDCSFCIIFWCSIIYLICNNSFSLFGVSLALLFALTPDIIKSILNLIKDIILIGVEYINKKLIQ